MKTLALLFLLVASSFVVKAQKSTPPPPPPLKRTTDTTGVFDRVEKEATFPGGEVNWREYIKNNFKVDSVSDLVWNQLPDKAKSKKGILQIVAIVQFIVCTDGTVCNVEVLNKVPPAFKSEAERLITESKLWEPAEQNGRKVKAYRKQPITMQFEVE